MNETEAQSLADYAVSRGTMTRAQADAGLAGDLSPAPAGVPSAPSPEAMVRQRAMDLVASGQWTQAQAAQALHHYAVVPIPGNEPARPAATPAAAPPAPATREVRDLKAMADGLVKSGRLSREDADKLLAADVYSIETGDDLGELGELGLSKTADPLGETKLDPMFDRLSSPDLYRFPPLTSGNITPNELGAMRELAWQARVPLPIAHEMAAAADTYAAKQMTEAEIALLTKRTMADLNRRYGDETPAKVALAVRLVADVSKVNPAVRQLIGTGVGSDPVFVMQVIEHAARVYGGK